MPLLHFPTDRIVGTVDWDGSWTDDRGPVLASGAVQIPDGVEVSLDIRALLGSEPAGDGSWSTIPAQEPVHLGFLRDLPRDAIEAMSVGLADEASFDAVVHLAPRLRQLCLGWMGFTDAVLPSLARLTGLTFLQTFGNNFTDPGVQQLAALVNLGQLHLEEETLTVADFEFVARLPHLTRLGLQDVPLSQGDLEQLRNRLAGVDVG